MFTVIGSFSDVIEVTQFIVNTVGVVTALYGLQDAIRQHWIVTISGIKNGRRTIAVEHVWSEVARVCAQFVLLCMALLSSWLPPPENTDMPEWCIRLILTQKVGLLIVSLLLTIKSSISLVMRQTLYKHEAFND